MPLRLWRSFVFSSVQARNTTGKCKPSLFSLKMGSIAELTDNLRGDGSVANGVPLAGLPNNPLKRRAMNAAFKLGLRCNANRSTLAGLPA
jgi:hypothetical protein